MVIYLGMEIARTQDGERDNT